MKEFRYIKANAFTAGCSLGNPAACVVTGACSLSEDEMLAIAREHKGFVMEVVFCGVSEVADCKLTYYSSECEVDFCGHGTIAAMYCLIGSNDSLASKNVVRVETNRKGIVEVHNSIGTDGAVYISAPEARELPLKATVGEVCEALGLASGAIGGSLPIRVIDAGLRTLIVPMADLEGETSLFPDEQRLKRFTIANDIDIVLIFTMQTSSPEAYAHTRVFAPRFGYLEDPATGSGNSAFANYMLWQGLWDGSPITVEQGGSDRLFNSVRLKLENGRVLFGGRATKTIEGSYFVNGQSL